VTALAGIGLGLSMIAHRTETQGRRSPLRCLAGMVGGLAFLAQIAWLDAWTAVTVSGILTVLIATVRITRRSATLPPGRPEQSWAEVTYAFAGTASIALAYGILRDRWLAFVPIAFMAWGDNTAGLARATIWNRQPASHFPSLCMFGVCLVSGLLFRPWWIAAAGGLVATLAERYRPRLIRWCDDNPIVVAASLGIMAALLEAVAWN
jgi:hypothetical protein